MLLIAILFASVVLTNSCRKQEYQNLKSIDNEFNILVKNNLLVFRTVKDYEKVVNNPSDETKNKFLATINSLQNFTSLNEINGQQLNFRI